MYPVPSGGNIIGSLPVSTLAVPPHFGSLMEQRDGGGKLQVKRRRRCGQCEPCLVKENCNECQFCLRKDVLKQACIRRKCIRLRKQGSRFPHEPTASEIVKSKVKVRESSLTSPTTNSCSSNVSPDSVQQSPVPGDYDGRPSPASQPVNFSAMPAVTGMPSLQTLSDQGRQDLLGHHNGPQLSSNTGGINTSKSSSLAGDPRIMDIGNSPVPNFGQNLFMSSFAQNPYTSSSSSTQIPNVSDSLQNLHSSSFTQVPYISDSVQNSHTSSSAQNTTNSSTTSTVNLGIRDSFPPINHFQSAVDQWGMSYGYTRPGLWNHPGLQFQPNPSALYGCFQGSNHYDYSNSFGSASQFGMSSSASQRDAPTQPSFVHSLPFPSADLTTHGGYSLPDYQHSSNAHSFYQSPPNSCDSRTNFPAYGYSQFSAEARQPMHYPVPSSMYPSSFYCPVSTPSEPNVYHVRGPSVWQPFRNICRSLVFPHDLLWGKVKNMKEDMDCMLEKCTIPPLKFRKGLGGLIYGNDMPADFSKCSIKRAENARLTFKKSSLDRYLRTEVYLLQLMKEFCIRMRELCSACERPRQVCCVDIPVEEAGIYRCTDVKATVKCTLMEETGKVNSTGAGEVNGMGPSEVDQNECYKCIEFGSVQGQTFPPRCSNHKTTGCDDLPEHICANVNIAVTFCVMTVHFFRIDNDNACFNYSMAATVSYGQLHISSQGCEISFTLDSHNTWDSMRKLWLSIELILLGAVLISILL